MIVVVNSVLGWMDHATAKKQIGSISEKVWSSDCGACPGASANSGDNRKDFFQK